MVELENETVCVTGGGGYLASWLIKFLLCKGYRVHATVRDPDREKNAYLKTLENASENLQLFKAELMDYDSLYAAIKGCKGVFHLASPVLPNNVPNPEKEILEAAVTGTCNVLKACSIENVRRAVVISSISAVIYNPNWPKDKPMDESCWSDHEFCKTVEPEHMFNWYHLAKTIAETQALEYGKRTGLDVVTVCPSLVIGPVLHPTMSASTMVVYKMLKDGLEVVPNKVRMFVDVRDVAEAMLLVYEKPEAEGRYICSSHTRRMGDFVDKMKSMFPNYNYPKQIIDVGEEDWDSTSEKLQKLGWKIRSLEESIADSVQDYQDKGFLE